MIALGEGRLCNWSSGLCKTFFRDSGHQLFVISILDQGGGNWLKQQPEGVYMEEFPDPGMGQHRI